MFKLAPSGGNSASASEKQRGVRRHSRSSGSSGGSTSGSDSEVEVETPSIKVLPAKPAVALTSSAVLTPNPEQLPIWEDYMPNLSKKIRDLNRILAHAVESGSLKKGKKKGPERTKIEKAAAAATAAAAKKRLPLRRSQNWLFKQSQLLQFRQPRKKRKVQNLKSPRPKGQRPQQQQQQQQQQQLPKENLHRLRGENWSSAWPKS